MIEEAKKRNAEKQIEYRVCGIEEYDYPENRFNSNIVSIHDKNSLLFLP